MSKDRTSQVYDFGFAQGYSGDPLESERFLGDENSIYEDGYKEGSAHFDRVMEIVEVTGSSLREVHQFAINELYEDIRERILL